jgi:hypothetical protein
MTGSCTCNVERGFQLSMTVPITSSLACRKGTGTSPFFFLMIRSTNATSADRMRRSM